MDRFNHFLTEVVPSGLKLITVEPYLFFCLVGYMVRLASFQDLLMGRSCRSILGYSDEICKHLDKHAAEQADSIEAGNTLYTGVMLMNSLPAVVVTIFLGPWSDKYSRRYPLIISACGLFLEALCNAALTFSTTASPVWYVVVALFSGMSGGFIVSNSAAFSYISDITDERSRPARFAVVEFSNISAIVIGTLLGAQIFEAFGHRWVMTIAPICFGCSLLYAIFFVKEIKPKVPDNQRCEMFRDLLSLDNIKQSYITCSKKRPGNLRLQIWLLVWISFCQKFADMGTISVGYPFAKKMYQWGVTAYSNATIAYYVVNATLTIVVLPVLSNQLRLHEAAIGLIGTMSLVSKMFVTSLAYKEFIFYFAWMSGALSNAAGVAAKARLSKLVNKEELGRAFSLIGTCESVTPLIGSTTFLQIYNASNRFFPGLAFAVAGVFLLPCLFIFTWMMKLPTVSLSAYGREDELKGAQPLEDVSNYHKLQEEKY